jgi:hypothetical protein
MTYAVIRQQTLQLRALILQLLLPLGVRQLHPARPGLPVLKQGKAATVLATDLGRGAASFLRLDHSDDLRFGETAFPTVVCSFKSRADSRSD